MHARMDASTHAHTWPCPCTRTTTYLSWETASLSRAALLKELHHVVKVACQDDHSCLMNTPGWGSYSCAPGRGRPGVKKFCGDPKYMEDLKCCPVTCGTCKTSKADSQKQLPTPPASLGSSRAVLLNELHHVVKGNCKDDNTCLLNTPGWES